MSHQNVPTWSCSLCSFANPTYNTNCEMCDSKNPHAMNGNDSYHSNNIESNHEIDSVKPIYYESYDQISQRPSQSQSTAFHKNKNSNNKYSEQYRDIYAINMGQNDNKQSWKCQYCTFLNTRNVSQCEVCENKYEPEIIEEFQRKENKKQSIDKSHWQCNICTYINHIDLSYCETCLNQREPNHMNIDTNDKSNEMDPISNKLNDMNISMIRPPSKVEPIQANHKHYSDDFETAKLIQQQFELEQGLMMAQQIQLQEEKRIQQMYDDIDAAKQLEQKYQADALQFDSDRGIALKMQKEFAQGLAWFCGSCFAMNLDIQSYQCQMCGHKRPKPKIPDVLTVRDQVCMKMIEMLRDAAKPQNLNCIVNLALAQNFVTKYLQMCKQRGLQLAQPQICYHWTKSQFFNPIKQTGLKVPDGQKVKHVTDTGYYGKGIYMSPCPRYAQGYGHGAKQFFVAIALCGKVFPAKYPRDLGIGLKNGYDCHHSSDNVNQQTKLANEWVFYKTEQLLLCFQITLEQVQFITPILNSIINYLVSKYDDLNKKGGIRGL